LKVKRRPKAPRRQVQKAPQEVRDAILGFIQGKLYSDSASDRLAFTKDTPRLLEWVVLWPATWLDERGVTLEADRYQEIILGAIMEAIRHGDTGRISYRPAWLGRVVQSHFAHREDQIYAEAKELRTALDSALRTLGSVAASSRSADPVRNLADAHQLLRTRKPRPEAATKPTSNGQLTLL
jgi:hypothetical protein